MKTNRPINLNLFTIQFPIPAIASIFHRVSGVALFILIPFIMWIWSESLRSPESFDQVQQWLLSPVAKFIFWLILVPFCYHLVAGIRHLLMDVHIGDDLKGGRLTAQLTMVITAILVILAGIWIW